MSPDAPLDPCRQWLGIDAADLGDHRRVLGIAPDERDPLVVLRAAESRLSRLREVSAGALEFVRTGFVKRVEAARESVLAEIAAAGPRAEAAPAFRRPPAPSTVAPPAAPMSTAPVPPTSVSTAPAGPPPVPRPAVPPPVVVPPPAVAVDGGPSIAIRTTVYRKQTPVLGITAAMIGLSAVAGCLAYYVLVVKPTRATAVADRDRGGRDEEDEDGTERPASTAASGSRSSSVEEDPDRPPPRARPRRPRTGAAEKPQTAASPAMAASGPPAAKPKSSRDDAAAEPPAASKPQPAAGMAEQETAEESRRLDAALADVLVALRQGRHDAAGKMLDAAATAARSTAARGRLAGWRRLAESHRRFVESRSAALDAVEPGTRYEVAGKDVVIEKIDDAQCVYRASGPAKTVTREKMPAGIVIAIVSAWHGDDPDGDLAIAAYQLVRDEPELRLARDRLEKARDAGADVEPLLTLLEAPPFASKAAAK